MDRIAVYTGTRNIYHDMVVAAKSLLCNDGADLVVFLIEDQEFPEPLPLCIDTLDVSQQSFFPVTGPNFKSQWSYMVLMRTVLSKLFPQCNKLLTLDHDTFVLKPIYDLWNIDLSRYYYAAVEEKQIRNRQHSYFNCGVLLHNLKKLREDHTDDIIINSINSVFLRYCEQDAINSVCARHILEIPPKFNAMRFNIPPVPEDSVIIKHYAARSKPLRECPEYKRFDRLSWEQVLDYQKEVRKNETL